MVTHPLCGNSAQQLIREGPSGGACAFRASVRDEQRLGGHAQRVGDDALRGVREVDGDAGGFARAQEGLTPGSEAPALLAVGGAARVVVREVVQAQ